MSDGEPMETGPASGAHGAKCGGTNRKGGPCGNAAGYKTEHAGYGNCHFHGGSSPNGQIHAERVAAEQVVARFGLDLDGTPPGEIVLREIQRSSGMVQMLAAEVAGLAPEERAWSVAARKIRPSGEPGGQPRVEVEQRAREHVLIGMLRAERRELRELIVAAHAAGIQERQIALMERQGAQIAAAFGGLLAELRVAWQLDAKQQEEYRAGVARQLHRLAAIERGRDRG